MPSLLRSNQFQIRNRAEIEGHAFVGISIPYYYHRQNDRFRHLLLIWRWEVATEHYHGCGLRAGLSQLRGVCLVAEKWAWAKLLEEA